MRFPIIILALLFSLASQAAVVDTVSIYSASMKKEIKCVVIRPGKKKTRTVPLPVVYLLHGYSGNYRNWITLVPELKKYSDEFGMIIVCPDGHYSSWYFDSPIDSTMRYETFVAVEVPDYIDKHYSTINNRSARAITGLSMGGHGGLFLGFRHADRFGAAGSMSGGVDLNSSRNRYDIIKRIGDTTTNAQNWKDYSVINVVEKKPSDSLAIIIDCGTEDFFYQSNVALHQKMLRLKIPHEYVERPGKHNWDYWRIAVRDQLYFFKNYFDNLRLKWH
jgi:S-formylglutathione hydrolase FrmB